MLGVIIVTWKQGLTEIRVIIVNETDRTPRDRDRKPCEDSERVGSSASLSRPRDLAGRLPQRAACARSAEAPLLAMSPNEWLAEGIAVKAPLFST